MAKKTRNDDDDLQNAGHYVGIGLQVAVGVALGYFVASTVVLIAPVYTWLGNRIEPRVLGLPWSLVYVFVVIALNCAVLAGLYAGRVIDHEEPVEPVEPDDRGTDR